jgi:hypothetical protein
VISDFHFRKDNTTQLQYQKCLSDVMNTMLEVDDGKVVSFVTGKLIQIRDESKHLTAVMRTLLERRVQAFLYTWNECGLYEDLPDVKDSNTPRYCWT